MLPPVDMPGPLPPVVMPGPLPPVDMPGPPFDICGELQS